MVETAHWGRPQGVNPVRTSSSPPPGGGTSAWIATTSRSGASARRAHSRRHGRDALDIQRAHLPVRVARSGALRGCATRRVSCLSGIDGMTSESQLRGCHVREECRAYAVAIPDPLGVGRNDPPEAQTARSQRPRRARRVRTAQGRRAVASSKVGCSRALVQSVSESLIQSVRCGTRNVLTRNGLWRSLVSAIDWGSRGRRFKSGQPDL